MWRVLTFIEVSRASNSGDVSLSDLLKSDIPALGDLEVTELENSWLALLIGS